MWRNGGDGVLVEWSTWDLLLCGMLAEPMAQYLAADDTSLVALFWSCTAVQRPNAVALRQISSQWWQREEAAQCWASREQQDQQEADVEAIQEDWSFRQENLFDEEDMYAALEAVGWFDSD